MKGYYNGNKLTKVRDNAVHDAYNGATDFYTDNKEKEYPLTYNSAGSLVSDAGRKIAKIQYDSNNNPTRIQFTNGNVTKYVYSATGEKLRVIYQTAIPNIEVAIGSKKELDSTEIKCTETVDYLLGGALTIRNGRIDKYQFEEGYCKARKAGNKDYFTFCYYDQDHLGNIRQVTQDYNGMSKGKVIQTMNYYPFGAEFCDNSTKSYVQNHKYNGKEFDNMHGLNTYDYGARQYNPVTARWDRMDQLSEDYYPYSPYNDCLNNPVKNIDPDGNSPTIATGLIGAACGAIIGGAIEAGTQLYNNGKITNWRAVGGAAVQGGITGGVAGLTCGASLVVTAGTAATANVAGGYLNSKIQGSQYSLNNAIGDFTIGGVFGTGGKLIGNGLNSLANNSPIKDAASKLTNVAHRALTTLGDGKGSVYGTKAHGLFSSMAEGMKVGKYQIKTEVSYLNGQIVKHGTKGSARIDAGLYNSKGQLVAVFDLKTGGASLTAKQVAHIQKQTRTNVEVIEIRGK